MPGLRNAVANGNWSNSATWDLGLFPGVGDTVCANSFNININQDINVGQLTTAAVNLSTTGITPTMTSNITPVGYIADASSINGGGFEAFRAFDKSQGGGNGWRSNTINTGWISYEFPAVVAIDRYRFFTPGTSGRIPKDWTFEGWNGSSWIVLHTVTGASLASSTTYDSGLLGNTTTYIKYRMNVTAVATAGNLIEISEIYLFELNYTTLSGVAGGGFTITGSRNITCTDTIGIQPGTTTCITYSANSPEVSTITGNIYSSTTTNIIGINKSGTSTLNFVGIVDGNANNAITISNGTLNINGTVRKTGSSISNVAILNITGATTTVNITGNVSCTIVGGGSTKRTITISDGILNITGIVDGTGMSQTNDNIVLINGGRVNITGTVFGTSPAPTGGTVYTTANVRIDIIGPIIATGNWPALTSTSTAAINLLSGPFICSTYGGFPYYVTRMHLIPTLNNYIEFRDNSTNGVISPGPIASASRMVSADTIIDAPSVSNVRFGVSYGNGAFTGTCRIPSASNVALNVPFDTGSIGTAYIDANTITNEVWGILTGSLTTPGSIGERLKNSSTVDTTGAQLASLL